VGRGGFVSGVLGVNKLGREHDGLR